MELVIALAITATLLTSVMVALNASFMAYQTTTEVASTHTIGRLTMHRILAMIRTGREFWPRPEDPLVDVIAGDEMTFETDAGIMKLRWDPLAEALYVSTPSVNGGEEILLLEGVIEQTYPVGHPNAGEIIMPFTLEFVKGRYLHRATIDLAIQPDDNMHVDLDGQYKPIIRLVGSAMPRVAAY
ncbi:MAG: hypothetical protein L0Y42_01935 [Phycisphaerales bacterium]|nr:hypothetical protein [Phycisphaerales bacterium]